MRFHCRRDYYPAPFDPGNFICPMTVDVICSDSEDKEVIAAKLAIDHLDLERAGLEGQSILDVCDDDSAGWEHIYAILFEPETDPVDPELRTDFHSTDPISEIIFIHKLVIHPSLVDWQSFILHHVSATFHYMSATVMWNTLTSLSDSQLGKLGYRMIADEELLFCPNMLAHEYSPGGEENVLDLVVPKNTEVEVLKEWNRPRLVEE